VRWESEGTFQSVISARKITVAGTVLAHVTVEDVVPCFLRQCVYVSTVDSSLSDAKWRSLNWPTEETNNHDQKLQYKAQLSAQHSDKNSHNTRIIQLVPSKQLVFFLSVWAKQTKWLLNYLLLFSVLKLSGSHKHNETVLQSQVRMEYVAIYKMREVTQIGPDPDHCDPKKVQQITQFCANWEK